VSTKQKRVVVLDDDRDVAEVIQTILLDEGFAVSCLYGPDYEGVATAVKDLAPDCVILDGAGSHETDPWVVARSLAMLKPAIPTVMLSGSETNREEAILGESDRAKQSAIAAVVPKPFDIDRLVLAVRNAMGAAAPSDVSRKAATADTERLLERLRAAGAHDLRQRQQLAQRPLTTEQQSMDVPRLRRADSVAGLCGQGVALQNKDALETMGKGAGGC